MTDYFVKNGGNDAASGLDDDNAWETISEVNTGPGPGYSAGDSIYFKKDDTWYDMLEPPSDGSDGSLITFGAYGAGSANPIISGHDIITGWAIYGAGAGSTYLEENIGCTVVACQAVIVDGTTKLTYNADEDNLAEGEFYHNKTDDDLYIRLSGDADPSGYTIEAHVREAPVKPDGKDYLRFENLTLRGGSVGYWVITACTHHEIEDCEIEYTGSHFIKVSGEGGGGNTYINFDGVSLDHTGGYGVTGSHTGIRIDGASNNNTFENITLKNCESIAVYQTDSDSNIFRHNWFESGSSGTVNFVTSDSNQVYYNVLIQIVSDYDNTIQFTTGAVNNEVYNNVIYSSDSDAKGFYVDGTSTGAKFKNNIVALSDRRMKVLDGGETNFVSDNNCFDASAGTDFHWRGTDYNFADWKTQSGGDANSINVDPLMIDPANDDFKLAMNSPCIDVGTDVSLTEDYIGTTVPYPTGGTQDMGAYENEYFISSVASASSMAGVSDIERTFIGSPASISAVGGGAGIERTLIGAPASTSSVTGKTNLSKTIIGSPASVSSVTGNAIADWLLSGTIASTSTLAQVLNAERTLISTVAGMSSTTSNVNILKPLISTALSESSSIGAVLELASVVSQISSVSTVTGGIGVEKTFIGAPTTASLVSGLSVAEWQLKSSVSAGSGTAETVNIERTFIGNPTSGSAVAGGMEVERTFLAGIISATSTTTAALVELWPGFLGGELRLRMDMGMS